MQQTKTASTQLCMSTTEDFNLPQAAVTNMGMQRQRNGGPGTLWDVEEGGGGDRLMLTQESEVKMQEL
jgi:hypothetical protein